MTDDLEFKIRVLLGLDDKADLQTMLDDAIDRKYGEPVLQTEVKQLIADNLTSNTGLANQDETAAHYFQ